MTEKNMVDKDARTCKYCNRSLKNRRSNAKFCMDNHRILWHLDKQRREREFAIKILRSILKQCMEKEPGLRETVNAMLSEARLEGVD